MLGMYEKFFANEKARVAKCTVEQLWSTFSCIVRYFAKIWLDRPFKEGTYLVSVVPTAVDHASQQTLYPDTMDSTLKDSTILAGAQYNY